MPTISRAFPMLSSYSEDEYHRSCPIAAAPSQPFFSQKFGVVNLNTDFSPQICGFSVSSHTSLLTGLFLPVVFITSLIKNVDSLICVTQLYLFSKPGPPFRPYQSHTPSSCNLPFSPISSFLFGTLATLFAFLSFRLIQLPFTLKSHVLLLKLLTEPSSLLEMTCFQSFRCICVAVFARWFLSVVHCHIPDNFSSRLSTILYFTINQRHFIKTY